MPVRRVRASAPGRRALMEPRFYTVYAMIARGNIKAVRIGNRPRSQLRIMRSSFDKAFPA